MKTNTEISLRRHLAAAKIASIALTAAALFIAGSPAAQAASATWSAPLTGGSYFWTTTADWTPGVPGATGNPNSTTCTDTATFAEAITGVQTITIDSGRNVENIAITTAASGYTFIGGPLILTAGGSISQTGAGAGGTIINNTITLEGSYTFSDNSSTTLGLGVATNSGLGGGAITMVGTGGGTLTLNGTQGTALTVNSPNNGGGYALIGGALNQATGQTLTLVKNGTGTWGLTGTNSFTGSVTIDGGILNVLTLANAGTSSSIGQGTSGVTPSADIIINGGVLQVSGISNTSSGATANPTGFSTNRLIQIGDASSPANTAGIDSSNTYANYLLPYNTPNGTISFTNTGAVVFGGTAGNHTLTLSGLNISNNVFDPQLTDQNTGAGQVTNLVKSGPSVWVLGNSNNTYTGTTTINGGILSDLTGSGVSPNSQLIINVGTYQDTTNITRTLGTAAGNVEITGGRSGFSAYNTTPNSTINLILNNNANSVVQFGSTFFSPQEYILNAPTANSTLNAENSYDLNGATRTIVTNANTAIMSGAIINSSANFAAGLDKAGTGTLELTAVNSYNGLTGVSGGVLWAHGSGTLGANTGAISVAPDAELRVDSLSAIPGTVLLSHDGALGVTFNATQAGLAAAINSNSSGILALDAAQSNALNMAALGNGAMYLGSSTGGAYSASTLGINSGGTELDSGGAPNQIATFGGYYLLGGGGSTLTITGQNVLTNQATSLLLNNYTGTAPGQSLLTSNNYNSLIVGDGSTAGQPNGGGTVDLQNSQTYFGSTTVNAGNTLNLDYSGGLASVSTAGNVNIISQYSPVTINGGTLEVTGGAGSVDTQTLGGVTSNQGGATINVNANGATSVTLNAGALTANKGDYFVIENQTGSAAAAVTTTTGLDASGLSFGPQYLFDNNGAYTWAGTTSGSSPYTIAPLTGESTLTATAVNTPTTNYALTASGTTTAAGSDTLNLLRLTPNSAGNTLAMGTHVLTANGILYNGSGTATISGTSGITSSSGNLYIYNYGSGTLNLADTLTGSTNVIFGGTGVIAQNTGFGTNETFTGLTYIDGATVSIGENNAFFGAATSGIVINSGALEGLANTSGTTTIAPLYWNGNFSLLRDEGNISAAGNTYSGAVTMTNNITITQNTGGEGSWVFNGAIGDAGFGRGLTIGANSASLYDPAGVNLNQPLFLGGANTFTGPLTILGDGVSVGTNSLNRFMTVSMAADTYLYFTASQSLAGLADAGTAANTENVINNAALALSLTFFGNGVSSFGGSISNGTGGQGTSLVMDGSGTQILTGTNTFTGGITVNNGTLNIDASKGGSIATQALALGGGTFELTGASGGTTQSFTSTGVSTSSTSAGLSKIEPNSTIGTTTINLGAVSVANGGVLDVAPIGSNVFSVTTTTANTTGVLGLGNVVYTNPTTGVTTWATAGAGGGVATAITAYTGDTTALLTTGNSASTNYNITGSQTQGAATGVYNLRISNTSTNTLNLSTFNLALSGDGVLYNGSAAYTITGGSLNGNNGANQLVIDNFGTGGLTIASTIGNRVAGTATALTLAGTGTTYLTGTNTYTGTTYFDGGTVNFNSSNNFSGSTAFVFGGGTLQYATGNTYDLSNKTLTPNAAGATFDTNGNAVTWNHNFGNSGVGGITFVDSANAANPGSAAGSITIFGDAQNTGAVTVDNGGVVNLNGALNTAGYTYVGPLGTLEGGTTQATSGTQSTSSAYAGKLVLQSGGVVSPGSPGVGASPNSGGAGTGIQGGGVGSGGNLNANVGGIVNNVLSATQLQWYAGGTLSFYLDDTGYAGASAGAPVASTQLNLALGSLAKMGGTGQYILNFNNTGGYYVNGGTVHSNVYDLINFGSSVNTTLDPTASLITNNNPNGNTNFNVDDFTIENLDGIGVLSFYYNSAADGGAGQEELLLTVIPEPSTWAMLIGGLATLIFWTRRKRAAANRSLARK